MASTRTRLDATALKLVNDPIYTDIWADTTKAGVTARSAIALKYTGNASASDDLATPAPTNGIINYPTHIAPLWTRNRGANTCTGCHNDPDKLDLSAALGGSGRNTSYEEIMLGDPQLDPVTGLPLTRIEEGVLVIVRGPALVDTAASEGEALGLARKSRLLEIMTGQTLMSGADARAAHPNPPSTAPDHSKMLNAARAARARRVHGPGRQVLQRPVRSGRQRAHDQRPEQETFRDECPTYPHYDVRCRLPPGHRQ